MSSRFTPGLFCESLCYSCFYTRWGAQTAYPSLYRDSIKLRKRVEHTNKWVPPKPDTTDAMWMQVVQEERRTNSAGFLKEVPVLKDLGDANLRHE